MSQTVVSPTRSYVRTLMKIPLEVRVSLASTSLPVERIVQLAPGSMIQFAKSADDPLEIRIGDTVVAHGEAVKVGDKFGVRLVAITMPPERFRSLLEILSRRQASSQRAG